MTSESLVTTDPHAAQSVAHGAHHVCTQQLFAKIFASLLVLTTLTVVASRFDFGGFNMIIAMAIAALKASLVMSVFMHMRWDTAINNIAFLSSLIFLALLILFTLADFATRGDTDPILVQRSDKMMPADYYDWSGH